MLCNLSSTYLIIAGIIAGGVTMNPIVLGIIAGSGLIMKTYCKMKDFKRKRSNYVDFLLLPIKRHLLH